jgi:Surface antigen variable number repeat
MEISSIDGSVHSGSDTKWVNVTARVQTGSAYTLGRIDFSGHHRVNESTLRRAMNLREHSLLDLGKLRDSLATMNRSGLFEAITLDDVEVRRNPETLTADLTMGVRERPGRRWSLSGPLGPAAVAGPLQATISSRLPPWGRGLFEASTYYLTFSVVGPWNPVIRLLTLPVRASPPAVIVLERPYLPGQALLSGFALSPQLSPRSVLANYGLTHLSRAAQAVLIGEQPASSGLVIPVSGRHASRVDSGSEEARFLICNQPAPRYRWLRRAAALAADLALGAFRPY